MAIAGPPCFPPCHVYSNDDKPRCLKRVGKKLVIWILLKTY